MCRSKVWRMRKVLSDDAMQLKWAVLSWTATPLDHLFMRLQYLDSHGKSLLDCIGKGSPFAECRWAFSDLLRRPTSEGYLSPLFWYHSQVEDI
jgi:hypothetical protein